MYLVSVVCCQVEVSESEWSLVHRSPTDCGVSECDHESSIMRTPWPTRAVAPWKKNPSGRTMALASTQPLTEMSTRNNYWEVRAAGV